MIWLESQLKNNSYPEIIVITEDDLLILFRSIWSLVSENQKPGQALRLTRAQPVQAPWSSSLLLSVGSQEQRFLRFASHSLVSWVLGINTYFMAFLHWSSIKRISWLSAILVNILSKFQHIVFNCQKHSILSITLHFVHKL